jgi:hypothetical protein
VHFASTIRRSPRGDAVPTAQGSRTSALQPPGDRSRRAVQTLRSEPVARRRRPSRRRPARGGDLPTATGLSRAVVARLPRSVRPDLDPSRPCLVATRNRQLQHAVLQVCIDLRCVEVRAQRGRARKMRFTDLGVLQPQTGGSWNNRFGCVAIRSATQESSAMTRSPYATNE